MNESYSPLLCEKPKPSRLIDPQKFCEELSQIEVPLVLGDETSNHLSLKLAESLYTYAVKSKSPPKLPNPYLILENLPPRWQRIIECDDPKTLWRAIDWKGEFDPTQEIIKPTDQEFRVHIEELLNPSGMQGYQWPIVDDQVAIASLDYPITNSEVKYAIDNQANPQKGAGPDGISPGVLHLIPAVWLTFLTMLFDIVFHAVYPCAWFPAKLITLFKMGTIMDTNNYRGISVINSVANLYDYVINNRLISWYTPCRQQAGGQRGRGCTELILILRLWVDYCKRKRLKLFIAFIDFSKAYDRVPRGKLFSVLKSVGCGVVMLCALMSMYSSTTSTWTNEYYRHNWDAPRHGLPNYTDFQLDYTVNYWRLKKEAYDNSVSCLYQ